MLHKFNELSSEDSSEDRDNPSSAAHLPLQELQMPDDMLSVLAPEQEKPLRRVLETAQQAFAEDSDSEQSERPLSPAMPEPTAAEKTTSHLLHSAAEPAVAENSIVAAEQEMQFAIVGLSEGKAPGTEDKARAEKILELQAALRAVESAVQNGNNAAFPPSEEFSRPDQEIIEAVYRDLFKKAVRSVRAQFSQDTADALVESNGLSKDTAEGISKNYDATFVVDAFVQIVKEYNGINFGTTMPVPDQLLRAYFDEYLFRLGATQVPRTQDLAVLRVSQEKLRAIVHGNASWASYKEWLAETIETVGILPQPVLEAVGDAVGLRLAQAETVTGVIANETVRAKAASRKTFRATVFSEAVKSAGKKAVFAAQLAAAKDTETYKAAAVSTLKKISTTDISDKDLPDYLPIALTTLPLQDRRARVENAAAETRLIDQSTVERLLTALDTYFSKGDDGREFNLSREMSANDEPDAGRPFSERFSALPGELLRRSFAKIASDSAAQALSTRAAALRALIRSEQALLELRVPQKEHRMERDSRGCEFSAKVVGVPPGRKVRLTWRFLPFLGTAKRAGGVPLRTVEFFGNGEDSIVVVPDDRCGNGQSVRYTGAVAGQYWAEATLPPAQGELFAKTATSEFRAELRVWAVCERDGAKFDVTEKRVHGECTWHNGPSTRKRKLERAAFLPANFAALGENEQRGPIDLEDDAAVLTAVNTNTEERLLTEVYGFFATLSRVSDRLPEAMQLAAAGVPASVQEAVQRAPEENAGKLFAFAKAVCALGGANALGALPEQWAAALRAGAAKCLQAAHVRQVPVLVIAAVLQVSPAKFAMTPAESNFLVDTVGCKVMGEYLLAKRERMSRGEQVPFKFSERQAASDGSAAFQAVANATQEYILRDPIWRQSRCSLSDKLRLFSDTASYGALLEAAKLARLRTASAKLGVRATQWTGTHNARRRDPDWYAVRFEPVQGTRFALCELAQRGSELPLVYGEHEKISASVRAYNKAVADAMKGNVAAGGPGATASVLRVARLRGDIERSVLRFNETLAKTTV